MAHWAQPDKIRMFVSSLPFPQFQQEVMNKPLWVFLYILLSFMNCTTYIIDFTITYEGLGEWSFTHQNSLFSTPNRVKMGRNEEPAGWRVSAASSALTASVLSQTPDNLPVVSGRPACTSCGLSELPLFENTPNVSKRSAHQSRTLSTGCLSLGWRSFGTSKAEDRSVSLGSDQVFSPVCPDSFHIPYIFSAGVAPETDKNNLNVIFNHSTVQWWW